MAYFRVQRGSGVSFWNSEKLPGPPRKPHRRLGWILIGLDWIELESDWLAWIGYGLDFFNCIGSCWIWIRLDWLGSGLDCIALDRIGLDFNSIGLKF